MQRQRKKQNLGDELEQQKSQAFELSKRQVQYNVLTRELTSNRDLLQNVLKQIKETSLAVESNASNVTVVDRALVPISPSYPRKRVILAGGVVGGLLLGVLAAFLLSYLDNTVRTPEDSSSNKSCQFGSSTIFCSQDELDNKRLTLAAEQSELGSELLPSVSQSDSALPPIAYISSPKSLVAGSHRTIRTGLLLSQAGEPPRTILVTSAHSAEGKTTSSINIAACLASSGGSVVLIDADLRRPSVLKYFGIDELIRPGLSGSAYRCCNFRRDSAPKCNSSSYSSW